MPMYYATEIFFDNNHNHVIFTANKNRQEPSNILSLIMISFLFSTNIREEFDMFVVSF